MLTNLYLPFVYIHSYLRWLVIAALLYALYRSVRGWLAEKPWTKADRLAGLVYTISLDLQLTIGLVLYALTGFAAGMRFLGEHIIPMAAAVVLGHLGTSLPKRVEDETRKHKRAVLWFALSALLVLAAIPWSRPLLRGL